MKAFTRVEGPLAPLDRVDVDTDQIIPKEFLKRVERTGYGAFLFHGDRFLDDGSPDPAFVLNRDAYRDAPILVTGRNFGCGSSREHAAWALADFGIRAVVAPSFADIFQANCFQNGILPVTLDTEKATHLMEAALATPGYAAAVDLQGCTVEGEDGFRATFQVDPFRRRCLLEGTDEIDLTLREAERIEAWERVHAQEGLTASS